MYSLLKSLSDLPVEPRMDIYDQSQESWLVSVISSAIEQVCDDNMVLMRESAQNCVEFGSVQGKKAAVPIREYVPARLVKYMKPTIYEMIYALILIDHLMVKDPTIILNSYNVHRLFATALVITLKFTNDIFLSNTYYAKVIGVSVSEFNYLERRFIMTMDFDIWLRPDEIEIYEQQISNLVSYMSGKPISGLKSQSF